MTCFVITPDQSRTLETQLSDVPFPSVDADAPAQLLTRCPRAGQTPLLGSETLASQAGVGAVWIKDERARMGLGSFKALGAAYVIACDAQAGTAKGQTYVTASAGNHGLSVAAGAAAFQANAVIYLAQTVPEAFANRLRDIGAQVRRCGETYEESMAAAAKDADENGWILLSDSSWPGYIDRPHRLMEGYTVLMQEAVAQMDQAPTHIFLQAGVGGLAAACAAYARAAWGNAPFMTIVEPTAAPALYASIKTGTVAVTQGPVSDMGRLDCKEPSLIALKGLARDANACLLIGEDAGHAGSQAAVTAGLPSTPSGAAGLAGLLAGRDIELLGLDQQSRVLLILSEDAGT